MSGSRYLLDTSVLIWWLAEPSRLSTAVRSTIADPANAICCSVVNLWEIQIKVKLGKLDLDLPLAEIHRWVVQEEGWMVLPVEWRTSADWINFPLPTKTPLTAS